MNRIVGADRLMATAMELAQRLCANAPAAVRATRSIVEHSAGMEMERAWAFSDAQAARAATSADSREGPLAFAQKRAPAWTGH